MTHIGEKIRELRRKSDMTQEELAGRLNVTYQTVSKWETGVTSPDLSLIVPIARLFRVTTDELFDYSESADELLREDLERRYKETLKTGDLDVRLAISEEAVKAFPEDMKWLEKYASGILTRAIGDGEYWAERERVIPLFQRVVENCDDDEVKGDAIYWLVLCLNGTGDRDGARCYAELYPDGLDADMKEKLLIDCMTGDERTKRMQKRLLGRAEDLLRCLLYESDYEGGTPEEVFLCAEKIIDALIPDGNYLTFHYELYNIEQTRAIREIGAGNLEEAMLHLKKAREHAASYDEIRGEYAFTAPLFDHIRHNTEDWCITGTGTRLEDFRALLDLPQCAPIKSHKDFNQLIR